MCCQCWVSVGPELKHFERRECHKFGTAAPRRTEICRRAPLWSVCVDGRRTSWRLSSGVALPAVRDRPIVGTIPSTSRLIATTSFDLRHWPFSNREACSVNPSTPTSAKTVFPNDEGLTVSANHFIVAAVWPCVAPDRNRPGTSHRLVRTVFYATHRKIALHQWRRSVKRSETTESCLFTALMQNTTSCGVIVEWKLSGSGHDLRSCQGNLSRDLPDGMVSSHRRSRCHFVWACKDDL